MAKPKWLTKVNAVLTIKVIWWLVLVAILSTYLWTRYDALLNEKGTAFDIFVFLVWCALLLTPLFHEVEFFGIKLKREIEKLKEEVKEQIINLRTDVQNSIGVQSTFNPQIFLGGTPPPDSQLPELTERFKNALPEEVAADANELAIPKDVQFLFSARFSIEEELRRLNNVDGQAYVSIQNMTRNLERQGLITQTVGDLIREISSIGSAAIHGGRVSQAQFDFVRQLAPRLLATLSKIE